ncbi:MAG TPA: HAD family hydrolase [Ktedonobacteraceae bacterium]|nr:HAD family hydrolase [Ktedonobacteraceae bacterium]
MYKYDLVAIDIDGTLLDSQNKVSSSVQPLFREVEASGTGITLITGRPELTVAPLVRELGLTLPYVSSGGAQITDPATGEIIASFTLQREEVVALAELGRAFEAGLVAMETHCLYYEGSLEKLKLVHESVDIHLGSIEKIRTLVVPVDDVVQASPHPLKFTISDLPSVLARVETRLRTSGLPIYATYSSPVYLEVTNALANKGTALQRLAQHLNIPLERILVIGDSPNDISMFQMAGTAIAMGNAARAVKEAAHRVAPSNDEEGVAWVLRELVLNKSHA